MFTNFMSEAQLTEGAYCPPHRNRPLSIDETTTRTWRRKRRAGRMARAILAA